MSDKIEDNAINPNDSNQVNNKTNTFNLIVGIATLLIAILGATFAYFSATARGNENDVTVKSAFVSISYDGGTEIKASNLIPSTMQVALNKYSKPNTPFNPENGEELDTDYDDDADGDINRRCVDAKGKEVCYVYEFSIRSDSSAEYTDIIAYINVNKNEFQNLSYILYEVEYEMEYNEAEQKYKPVTDKYGIGVVTSLNVVSKFTKFDTNPDNVDYTTYGFATFEQPGDIIGENEETTRYGYPVACLFGHSIDYDVKDMDSPSRCLEYNMKNADEDGNIITHYYQLVIWLNETWQVQEEQGKTFEGTVVIEVSGGLDDADYTDDKITGIQ